MEKNVKTIFLILILCFNYSCSKKQPFKKSLDTSTNDITLIIPDMEIIDFTFNYTVENQLRWKLKSEKAEIYSKRNMKTLEKVDLVFYKNNRIDSKIKSKRGKHDEKKDILTAYTNVSLETSDGSILYTQLLNWDNKKSQLFTDQYVKIIKPNGDIIRGVGLIADSSLERLTIQRNVTGEIYEKN